MAVDLGFDAEKAVFLDTSLVVTATVDVHPSHAAATLFVDDLVAQGVQPCISAQVCREFMVVLTRQPVSGRVFTVNEALSALEVWITGCTVLDENEAVLRECLSLVRRHGVQGKQVHDCNIVATMKSSGVSSSGHKEPRRLQALS